MDTDSSFEIVFLGHFTRDTIVYPTHSRYAPGGAYLFGANVAARMGKRTAVITRLARRDWGALQEMEQLGVTVLARETPVSSRIKLTYAAESLDHRTLELTSSAGPFTSDQVESVRSRIFAIVPSSARGEVPTPVVEALAARGAIIALDVQGFVRVLHNDSLSYDDWPGKESILPHVTVVKTDAMEAALITGESDHRRAARRLAELGPREVLLTHHGGVLVYHAGVFHEAPFVPRALLGRTGRGDTCTAAYLCRRLTHPPEDAVVWAAAVTSLKLEEEGPFRREVGEAEALYQEMRRNP